ncbi:MAG: DUF4260 domain-containing protein [Flavobacteriales bacterium]
MKPLIKLEEAAQFMLCLSVLILSDAQWWVYLLLAVGPDIGMLGYLIGPRIGALTYNVLHHKAVALIILVMSFEFGHIGEDGDPKAHWPLFITGLILYGHASMDRILGYGLKFGDSFQHTHLDWIGKQKPQEQEQ